MIKSLFIGLTFVGVCWYLYICWWYVAVYNQGKYDDYMDS
jgi:hypothetical protein